LLCRLNHNHHLPTVELLKVHMHLSILNMPYSLVHCFEFFKPTCQSLHCRLSILKSLPLRLDPEYHRETPLYRDIITKFSSKCLTTLFGQAGRLKSIAASFRVSQLVHHFKRFWLIIKEYGQLHFEQTSAFPKLVCEPRPRDRRIKASSEASQTPHQLTTS
jgi:hypothetical protein